jgi:hypothetical protein
MKDEGKEKGTRFEERGKHVQRSRLINQFLVSSVSYPPSAV